MPGIPNPIVLCNLLHWRVPGDIISSSISSTSSVMIKCWGAGRPPMKLGSKFRAQASVGRPGLLTMAKPVSISICCQRWSRSLRVAVTSLSACLGEGEKRRYWEREREREREERERQAFYSPACEPLGSRALLLGHLVLLTVPQELQQLLPAESLNISNTTSFTCLGTEAHNWLWAPLQTASKVETKYWMGMENYSSFKRVSTRKGLRLMGHCGQSLIATAWAIPCLSYSVHYCSQRKLGWTISRHTYFAVKILWSTSSSEELCATWNVPKNVFLFFLIFSA